ncbi:MAG TPA: sulfite exporter TauE/SafE family protein, partial [Streptosporangiaceae bacterium]
MSIAAEVALLCVGVLAGIVSTVASLASVVSYPALLALGLGPVSANVTNTVALMFTGVGAAAGSRPELAGQGGRVVRLGLLTGAG